MDIGIAKEFIPGLAKGSVSGKMPGHRERSRCHRFSHRAEVRRLRYFPGVGFLKPADAGHTARGERGSLGRPEGDPTPRRAVPALMRRDGAATLPKGNRRSCMEWLTACRTERSAIRLACPNRPSRRPCNSCSRRPVSEQEVNSSGSRWKVRSAASSLQRRNSRLSGTARRTSDNLSIRARC